MPKEEFKKPLNLRTFVMALVISGILFGAGVYTGFSINKDKLSAIETEMGGVVRTIGDFQTQFLFFDVLGGNATCSLLQESIIEINDQAYEAGKKLTDNNPEHGEITDAKYYDKLMEKYSRILTNYWLVATKMKKECNTKEKTILFFIEKKACGTNFPNVCDDQGFVLDNIKRIFGKNLLVFTMHTDIKEPSIKALKDYYSVTTYPTIVIDGKKYEGFRDRDTLFDELCKMGLCR